MLTATAEELWTRLALTMGNEYGNSECDCNYRESDDSESALRDGLGDVQLHGGLEDGGKGLDGSTVKQLMSTTVCRYTSLCLSCMDKFRYYTWGK